MSGQNKCAREDINLTLKRKLRVLILTLINVSISLVDVK